ncbi:signal peptidase 22kDa subunit [Peziza echinospora]|nr:signal peptidase 22kDa subunit [Peziza echinospora]
MHTSLVRLQNLFGFFTTVTFFVGALIALSSVVLKGEPENVAVKVRNVQVVKGQTHQYPRSKQVEFAFLKFDLEADLTPLFNWNTKQVFAYLTASYPGQAYEENDAIIWDIIIPSAESARLKLKNRRAKYNFYDVSDRFKGQNATLTFAWNVQPHVGALAWDERGLGTFVFPEVKAKKVAAGGQRS